MVGRLMKHNEFL